jgi:hypothetical protein
MAKINDVKLISTEMELQDEVEISGLEELLSELLITHWIEEQNKPEEDEIECQSKVSRPATSR